MRRAPAAVAAAKTKKAGERQKMQGQEDAALASQNLDADTSLDSANEQKSKKTSSPQRKLIAKQNGPSPSPSSWQMFLVNVRIENFLIRPYSSPHGAHSATRDEDWE